MRAGGWLTGVGTGVGVGRQPEIRPTCSRSCTMSNTEPLPRLNAWAGPAAGRATAVGVGGGLVGVGVEVAVAGGRVGGSVGDAPAARGSWTATPTWAAASGAAGRACENSGEKRRNPRIERTAAATRTPLHNKAVLSFMVS